MRLQTLIVATFLLLPQTAVAYATPEEVLFSNQATHLVPPPRHRETGDRLDAQRHTSQERREREWQENYERQHPAPPPPADDEEDAVREERQQQREREELFENAPYPGGMTIPSWEDPDRTDNGSQDVLHSGAPLTPTGLGSWLGAAVILGTGILVIMKVKPATRKVEK